MKIIENKKLLGKINIIDIIIIILILVVGILTLRYFSKSTVLNNDNNITIKYYIKLEDMLKGSEEYVNIDDKVYDNEKNVYLGRIISTEVNDNIRIKQNYETNEFVSTVDPLTNNIVLCIETEVNDTGIDFKTVDDYIIKVGSRIYLRGPDFAGNGYIIKIER